MVLPSPFDALLDLLTRIVLVLIIGWASYALVQRLVPRLIRAGLRRQHEQEAAEEVAKREETLNHVVLWSANGLLFSIITLTLLATLGISIAPAIASLGIAGVAVGFGSQALVRDILSGLFILLEDQYRKGDMVRIAGVTGQVEEVNLRRTVLRDIDGTVHSVPNGEVRVASNLTREWSRVNLDIQVPYGTDVEKARSIIDRLGQELVADAQYGPMILEAPRLIRVEGFRDEGVVLKVLGTTRPMRQWDVAGELRRRMLIAFAQERVPISKADLAAAPTTTTEGRP